MEMWDRMQEKYEEKSVANKLTSIDIFLNENYKQERGMGDHVPVLELQFARFV